MADIVTVWKVAGKSIVGATHTREESPNEDAIGWSPESGSGVAVNIAVADGHGSKKSFRSEEGAQLAVGIAVPIMRDFLAEYRPSSTVSEAQTQDLEQVSTRIVRDWQAAVAQKLADLPLTVEELDILERTAGARAVRELLDNPLIAYGSTILGVVASPSIIGFFQLGDGDILTVSEEGTVERPLPRDGRLLGNETTSLCSPNALKDVRVRALDLTSNRFPTLILLATDGYVNSFRDDAGFVQVGTDLSQSIRQSGMSNVEASLADWLTETSLLGSGDDITLGLLSRQVTRPSIATVRAEQAGASENENAG